VVTRLWKVAHRGASAELPENTMPAFERAIAAGADVIEADVRLTKDGTPLVLHDATLERTTSGKGPLRAAPTSRALKLDAGEGTRIPRVRDVLELARGRVRVNLDIKEPDAVAPTVALVRELEIADHVTFISFLPEVWEQLARDNPGCPVIHLVDSAAGLASLAMGDVGARGDMAGVGVPADLVSPGLVERLRRQGHGVFAWTVDDEPEMRRLIDAGVNGIVTNRIADLVALAERMRRERERATPRD
jgi:glycerophosphoryl diester phosphodiesterase